MSRDLWPMLASHKHADTKSEASSSENDRKHTAASGATPAPIPAATTAAAAVGTAAVVPTRARWKPIPFQSLTPDQCTFIQALLQTALTLESWEGQSGEQQSDLIQRYDYDEAKTVKIYVTGLEVIPDLIKMILAYLGGDFGNLFAPQQDLTPINMIMTQDSVLFKKQLSVVPLLQQIVIGGYDRLKAMLDTVVRTHPLLLEQKGTVQDHNGYVYENVTPLQLARQLRDRDIWVKDPKNKDGKLIKVADGIEQLIEITIKACYEEADAIKMIWKQRLEIEPVETSVIRQLLGYSSDNPNRDTAAEQKQADSEGAQKTVEAFYAAMNDIRDADRDHDDAQRITQNCGQALATFINHYASQDKEAPAAAVEFLQDKIALREALRAIRVANTPAACETARETYRKYFADKSKKPAAEAEELLSDAVEVWKVNEAIRISISNTDIGCVTGLEAMRTYFKVKKIHNNEEELLYEAEKFYRKNFAAFSANNHRQNVLCSNQVIGYLQSLCPAFTLQIYAFGLYYLVEKGEKLIRSYEFRYDRGFLILPLGSNPSFRLGYEYFVGRFIRLEEGDVRWARREVGTFMGNLCRAKTSSLPVLCNVQSSNRILNLSAQ